MVKLIDVRLSNLEKLSEIRGTDSIELVWEKAARYEGTFLVVAGGLFRVPRLSFFDYDSVRVNCNEFGVYSQVVRGHFDGRFEGCEYLSGELADGSTLDFRRKYWVGQAKVK